MIALYSFITFSFFPMLIGLMCKIKKNFNSLYRQIRWKYVILLVVFMGFLLIRIYLYMDLKVIEGPDVKTTIYTPIPFYISEIMISMFLSYILFNVNDNNDESDN